MTRKLRIDPDLFVCEIALRREACVLNKVGRFDLKQSSFSTMGL